MDKMPDEFAEKHFVDSLLACAFSEFLKGEIIIDIGTGAGFPGLPLAICFSNKSFVLVDSLLKRVKILREIIKELGVCNVEAIHGRAEDLAIITEHREKYDFCLSRAVADLAVLSEYCLPFVKVGGYFGAYKTIGSKNELEESKKALNVLGGKVTNITEFPEGITDLRHHIYWVSKIKKTPDKYPRQAGIPSRNPIK